MSVARRSPFAPTFPAGADGGAAAAVGDQVLNINRGAPDVLPFAVLPTKSASTPGCGENFAPRAEPGAKQPLAAASRGFARSERPRDGGAQPFSFVAARQPAGVPPPTTPVRGQCARQPDCFRSPRSASRSGRGRLRSPVAVRGGACETGPPGGDDLALDDDGEPVVLGLSVVREPFAGYVNGEPSATPARGLLASAFRRGEEEEDEMRCRARGRRCFASLTVRDSASPSVSSPRPLSGSAARRVVADGMMPTSVARRPSQSLAGVMFRGLSEPANFASPPEPMWAAPAADSEDKKDCKADKVSPELHSATRQLDDAALASVLFGGLMR